MQDEIWADIDEVAKGIKELKLFRTYSLYQIKWALKWYIREYGKEQSKNGAPILVRRFGLNQYDDAVLDELGIDREKHDEYYYKLLYELKNKLRRFDVEEPEEEVKSQFKRLESYVTQKEREKQEEKQLEKRRYYDSRNRRMWAMYDKLYKYEGDTTYREIGEKYDVSPTTVSISIRKAKKAWLKDWGAYHSRGE